MKNTLHELYRGNVRPCETVCADHREIRSLTILIEKNRTELWQGLTLEQKRILEKYEDCIREMQSLASEEIFAEGFRLGAKITWESATNEKTH